jgi:hypothetical protein
MYGMGWAEVGTVNILCAQAPIMYSFGHPRNNQADLDYAG